jgi:hypothetical protein
MNFNNCIEADQEKFCLWIDLDSGEIHIIPATTPIERVAYGGYVPHYVGTKKEMEHRKRQLILSRIKPRKHLKRI